MKILLLTLIFAFLNRVRGGGYVLGYKHPQMDYAAKIVSGCIIGWLGVAHWGHLWVLPIGALIYMAGESLAWGKWVGTLAYFIPDKREVKGFIETYIHKAADALYDDTKRPIAYSAVALAIRGCFWFVPVGLFLGNVDFGLLAGVLMPACYVASHYLPEQHWVNKWGLGEVIYGAVYGACLGVM